MQKKMVLIGLGVAAAVADATRVISEKLSTPFSGLVAALGRARQALPSGLVRRLRDLHAAATALRDFSDVAHRWANSRRPPPPGTPPPVAAARDASTAGGLSSDSDHQLVRPRCRTDSPRVSACSTYEAMESGSRCGAGAQS